MSFPLIGGPLRLATGRSRGLSFLGSQAEEFTRLGDILLDQVIEALVEGEALLQIAHLLGKRITIRGGPRLTGIRGGHWWRLRTRWRETACRTRDSKSQSNKTKVRMQRMDGWTSRQRARNFPHPQDVSPMLDNNTL